VSDVHAATLQGALVAAIRGIRRTSSPFATEAARARTRAYRALGFDLRTRGSGSPPHQFRAARRAKAYSRPGSSSTAWKTAGVGSPSCLVSDDAAIGARRTRSLQPPPRFRVFADHAAHSRPFVNTPSRDFANRGGEVPPPPVIETRDAPHPPTRRTRTRACRVEAESEHAVAGAHRKSRERGFRVDSRPCVRVAPNQRERFVPVAHVASNQHLVDTLRNGTEARAISRRAEIEAERPICPRPSTQQYRS
jgi:hypothetical protein